MSVIDGQDETETEQFKELYMKKRRIPMGRARLRAILDYGPRRNRGGVEVGARREGVAERKP